MVQQAVRTTHCTYLTTASGCLSQNDRLVVNNRGVELLTRCSMSLALATSRAVEFFRAPLSPARLPRRLYRISHRLAPRVAPPADFNSHSVVVGCVGGTDCVFHQDPNFPQHHEKPRLAPTCRECVMLSKIPSAPRIARS